MEDLTHLINEVNRQGYNKIDYQMFCHSHCIEIQTYVPDDKQAHQTLRVKYDDTFHKIISAELSFVCGIFVNQKLTESELFKIVRSYKEA